MIKKINILTTIRRATITAGFISLVCVLSLAAITITEDNMASGKEFLDYVLELLVKVDGITFKKMMGEYLLYKDGTLFGGVYDDRFLVKETPYTERFGLREALPYEGAKPMLEVDVEDEELVKEIVSEAFKGLSSKK